MSELLFLKLGGSLITDKTLPFTARRDKLASIAGDIADFLKQRSSQSRIILGHGSGSFGHTAARQYRTRDGVKDEHGWRGFVEVWYQASALNRIVMEALIKAGVPAMAFPPSACVKSRNRQVASWDLAPIKTALSSGLVPVIFGDVIFDEYLRGTILSTEDLFAHLASELHPEKILLAGKEDGVWADFPKRTHLLDSITPDTFESIRTGVRGSEDADVTGGMESKVIWMLQLINQIPGLQVLIFSGEKPGNVGKALAGDRVGTVITARDNHPI